LFDQKLCDFHSAPNNVAERKRVIESFQFYFSEDFRTCLENLNGHTLVHVQKVGLVNSPTYDRLIAEREEFHTYRDVSRFFKLTSVGYPALADPHEGRPYLCEQDTEGPIRRIEGAM
jgi:hypothetical protein